MIASVRTGATNETAALGPDRLRQFLALSRLHSDGWGTAWTDPQSGEVRVAGSATESASTGLPPQLDVGSAMRVSYLRFASRGAPPAPDNIQPFLRDGLAFAHNGLLAPRDTALRLLSPTERRGLRGTTDSEIYFALVRRALGTALVADRIHPAARLESLASAVAGLREGFPEACLNALLLAPDGLYVICSAGSAAPPLAAFAARGFGPERLPPGHDGSYNTMWTTVSSSGARLVTTTGIDLEGWQRLPADTVSLITAHGDRQLPIPPAP